MFQIFCDFDGTITSRDTIVFLTENFGAGSQYREQIFEDIKSGRITVFDAIASELATVTLSWEEAKEALGREISIDPTFPAFVRWCRRKGYPVAVASSGLRPVVELFVGHLEVPIYAHKIEFRPGGWKYERDPSMEKPRILRSVNGGADRVYVGDGTSDISVIPHVEWLFAKDFLASYCRHKGVAYLPFRDFEDVRLELERIEIGPGNG